MAKQEAVPPTAKNLTTVNLTLYWAPIPPTHNSAQLILDKTQIYKCYLKVSGDYFGGLPKRFRVQCVEITGTIPAVMTPRFQTSLIRFIKKEIKEILKVNVSFIPSYLLDPLEDVNLVEA